jgi:hypothetical protein
MAALTSNDLNIVPLINFDTKTIRIKDLLDYTAFGITPSGNNANGCYTAIQIQTADTFYNNTDFDAADIVISTSDISAPAVNFPLDSVTQQMLLGNFSIAYRFRYQTPEITIVSVQGPPANVFTVLKAGLGDYVPVIGTQFVTSGNINSANNGSWTVLGYDETPTEYTIQVSGTLVNESETEGAVAVFSFFYEKTFTFCLKEFNKPCVKIEQSYSCLSGTLTSKDVSAIGNPTSDALTHTLKYPQALGDQQPPDVVTSTPTINVGPSIWTMTWTSIVTHVLQYSYDDGTIIETTITGTKEIDVACFDLCCLLDGVSKLYEKFKNESEASGRSAYTTDYIKAIGLLNLIAGFSETCNDTEKAEQMVQELKDVLALHACLCHDCEACNGSSELPQEITPMSTSIIMAQFVALSPIPGLNAENVQQAIQILYETTITGINVDNLSVFGDGQEVPLNALVKKDEFDNIYFAANFNQVVLGNAPSKNSFYGYDCSVEAGNVFRNNTVKEFARVQVGNGVERNVFDLNSNTVIQNGCSDNHFALSSGVTAQNDVYENYFGIATALTGGSNILRNTIGNKNIINCQNSFTQNVIGNYCEITTGSNFALNILGSSVRCTFGINTSANVIGSLVEGFVFGNNLKNVTIKPGTAGIDLTGVGFAFIYNNNFAAVIYRGEDGNLYWKTDTQTIQLT